MAPEVFRRTYSAKADIFAAGIVLYMLLGKSHPFLKRGMNSSAILKANKACSIEFEGPRWKRVNQKAIDLVKAMTAKKPKERLSAAAALKHPWFRDHLDLE